MKTFSLTALAAAAVLSFLPLASAASTVDIMIGDDDGYGQGVADNGVVTGAFADCCVDNRSAAEQAATDGSQQTDINSSLFNPVANPASFIFAFTGTLTSATLTLDIGGLQKDVFGETLALFNGTLMSGLLAITETDYRQTRILSIVLDAAALARANADGQFVLTLDRNGNNDAIFLDYLRLTGESIAPVPLPAGLPLLAVALGGLGLLRRRAPRQA